MKKMIYTLAASSGGALSILNMYYSYAQEDKENDYIFVISTPVLKERDNIHVLNIPWVKKSWIHRLFFDLFLESKIVKRFCPDEILSLQNTYVGKSKIKQIIYLHQPLPFSKHRFKLIFNPKLWIYQNIIGLKIINGLKKADQVIVQTNWMKNACLDINPNMVVSIVPPKIDWDIKSNEYSVEDKTVEIKKLFYPASSVIYKNHLLLLKALNILNTQYNIRVKLYLTLDSSENLYTKKLFKYSKKNNIDVDFIGKKNVNEMISLYLKCALVFPSLIETYGLPILEARTLSRTVIASNTDFSKELLQNYDKCLFFDPSSESDIADKILIYIRGDKI